MKRDEPDDDASTPGPEPVAGDPVLPAAAGSTMFVCPAEAGHVDHAQLWYYRDHAGVEQGPFSMMSMRAWYEAGYFEGGVTVAASYFGEVPLQHWQIAELWEVPLSQAFVPAAGIETIVEAPVADPEFIPSAEFAGAREGYLFQIGDFGVGYYKDNPPIVTVTAESLEQEQLELKVKVRQLRTHERVPLSHPTVRRACAGGKDHSDACVCGSGPNYMTPREGCTVKVGAKCRPFEPEYRSVFPHRSLYCVPIPVYIESGKQNMYCMQTASKTINHFVFPQAPTVYSYAQPAHERARASLN